MSTLFATKDRQQQRLADLKAARLELLAEHDRAVASGDDAALDKIAAKLVRNQLDTSAAQAAIDAAQRLAQEECQRAAQEQRDRAAQEVRAAATLYRECAVEFERDVMALAEKWADVQQAFDAMRSLASDSAVELPYASRGLAPGRVWDRVWTAFLGAVKNPDRSPLVMPRGGPVNPKNFPSVASSFAKEDRASAEPAHPLAKKERS